MKRILGLDLGTSSIGWALVSEAETGEEVSSVIRLGVRVNPLIVDETQNFEGGKGITTNAERTLRRGMRRSLQRYKSRRDTLVEFLEELGFITDRIILSEQGDRTTFETCRLRARAAEEEISLEELSRVLLMINKKRGYKSSRRVRREGDGVLIDGMEIAKKLYKEDLTPGRLCSQLLESGKKVLSDLYHSDLQKELDRIWSVQKQFHPDVFCDATKKEIKEKSRSQAWAILANYFIWKGEAVNWNDRETKNEAIEKGCKLVNLKRTTKGYGLKKENYRWRAQTLAEQLGLEEIAVVLREIDGQTNASSGYLGAISDRSKVLYFNHRTVG